MKIIKAFLIYIFVSSVFAGEPMEIVKKTTDEILSALNAFKGDENKEKRKEIMKASLRESFDFVKMSQSALGKKWRDISKEQKKEFSDIFRTILENTYIGKMEQYTNEEITYGKEKSLSKTKTLVETFLKYNGEDIPISYKLFNKNNIWKVYDVTIEGVGLIKNYRSQFKEILINDSYDVLVKKLKEKIENEK